MTWNRTYRPKTIAQLHLVKVRERLSGLLKQSALPQAFLFAGPKGTGKTSASRILAAVLNDPKNTKGVLERIQSTSQNQSPQSVLLEPSLDDDFISRILEGKSYVVHELDAASNRGIDDIRNLKERVFLPPQEGVVSVFILDEAHMLTTEASNALLKILEEPPAHVVFILATTELHKILPTIISRCYTVEFSKASDSEILSALTTIMDAEKLTYELDALQAIIALADGSFRDAVKLAESVSVKEKKLTLLAVSEQLGVANISKEIDSLLRSIISKEANTVVAIFSDFRKSAIPEKVLYTQLLTRLHSLLVSTLLGTNAHVEWSAPIIQFLLAEFSTIEVTQMCPIPYLALELKCLDIISRSQKKKF